MHAMMKVNSELLNFITPIVETIFTLMTIPLFVYNCLLSLVIKKLKRENRKRIIVISILKNVK